MGRPPVLTGALTPRQLDAALSAFPRLSENGRAAAHRVLVSGHASRHVADDLGVNLQMVSRWVHQIHAQHCSRGRERRVATLPASIMRKVERTAREARIQYARPVTKRKAAKPAGAIVPELRCPCSAGGTR